MAVEMPVEAPQTTSYHLRYYDIPETFVFTGEIIGYGENTILVLEHPDDPEELQSATFMEVEVMPDGSTKYPVDESLWTPKFLGMNSVLLASKSNVPPVEPEPPENGNGEIPIEDLPKPHTPPRRTKNE